MDKGDQCYDTYEQLQIRWITMATSSGLSVIGSLLTIFAFFYFPVNSAFTDEDSDDTHTALPRPKSVVGSLNSDGVRPSRSSNSSTSSREISITSLLYGKALISGKRRPTIVKLILSLAFADLFLSGEVLGYHILLLTKSSAIGNIQVCRYMRAFFEFGTISSFLWTSNIAFTVYRTLLKNQDFVPRKGGYALDIINQVASWSIALAIALVFVFRDDASSPNHHGWCTPNGVYEWAFWFAPVFLSVLWNTIFFILFTIQSRRIFGYFATEYGLLVRIQRRLSLYLLVFVICWLWDMIIHFVRVSDSCIPFALFFLQELFSPLQGFLNFIVYTRAGLIKWRIPWKTREGQVVDDTEKRSDAFDDLDDAFAENIKTNISNYYADE